ncbi:MAG: hypothetical protein AAGC64_10105, partial [Bacteroidota bacterium]
MLEGPDKLVIILSLLLSYPLKSQEIVVKGGFVEDSLVIGQKINYWITAAYPPGLEMIFPDSNTTFSPFEFADKTYFPTLLQDSLAFDSTVYTLQSFEIAPIQYLQLAAIILEEDSTVFQTPLDSIFLTELALVVTDTTKLKTNLNYQAVTREFNYPLLYYILVGLAVLILILSLILGKRIIRYFKIRKLTRDYRNFSKTFSGLINHLKRSPEPETAEKALAIWKTYLERLDKVSFSSFTTKEILSLNFTQELSDPLKSIDKVVYGKRIQENVYQDFQQIEDFSDERFQKKIAEIKNGK